MNKQARFTSHGLFAALTILACCGAGSAMAADATATSSSTVVAPIAITKASDLAFGSFAAGSSGGSVTISPNGNRTSTGVILAGGTTTAAKFDVTGATGLTYSITLGGSTSLSNGTETMAFASISDLVGGAITSGNVTSGTLTGGAQSIFVGGVLTVAAGQAAGNYTGNVIATVEYN